jgi:hypothetical protein
MTSVLLQKDRKQEWVNFNLFKETMEDIRVGN